MPQKGKAKNAPNDKRHENNSGLAPPVGRRTITRQRSQGQLNGHANGKPAIAVTPPPLPSTGLNAGFKWPRSADTASESVAVATGRDYAGQAPSVERDRTPSDASVDEVGPSGEMADHGLEHSSAMHGGSDSTACKSSAPHSPATVPAVSTILTYYPLSDAISILILLLSLPPTLVLVIQTLFASLTFVPPTAGISLSTLPNIKEMFNSSNFGYPALATILIVDLLFWVCWLAVWKPMQAMLLDFSQAVIAVSLSGAAASTGGPTYSIATCTLIVCIVHVLRYKAIHLTALDYLRSVLHNWSGKTLSDASFATSFYSSTSSEHGMAFSAIRTILGIHIVSQGVATCIRRNLANAKANEKDSNIPAITKTDTEATAGTEQPPRLSSMPGAGPPPLHSSASTDGRPPGQPPARLDAKHRDSNSKKKRKQANQVRSQQPLWAAVASTKVTFVKEMEQRDAADDAREAAAMDKNNTTNSFATTTNTTSNHIWIREVRDTEVWFSVDLAPRSPLEDLEDNSVPTTAGIDSTKPFFVRVNGAIWSSARIHNSVDETRTASDRYDGQIFGLAPLRSYRCELVSLRDGQTLCSINLITQRPPTAEQAAAAPAPLQHAALRPSSPTTTVKQSIAVAEGQLRDIENRKRKTKRDQRSTHTEIRKEINTLKSKLESSGGLDDRQERRVQQISQHKNQAEEATADLKKQIEALGEIPGEELAESDSQRREWQSALDAKRAAERDFEETKAEQERELNALKSDIASSESRKEKLNSRKAQRAQELEKLAAQQHAEMTAKEKRDFDRIQIVQERENTANRLRFHTAQMDQETSTLMQKANDAYREASSLSSWSTQPPPGYSSYQSHSSPPTPEGILPNSNGQISPQANGFPTGAFNPPPFGSPFSAQAAVSNVNLSTAPRGRSSSMFSQYSGFTDNGEEYVFPPREQRPWPVQSASAGATMEGQDRKASDGGDNGSASGSGSASGGTSMVNGSTNGSNSPRPEAKPFVPKSVGTIGPPSKNKTPQSPKASNIGALGSGR